MAADVIDKDALIDNIHKTFSTPASLKMKVGPLKPSPVPGYLQGELVIESKGPRQAQPLLVAEDGSRYFLGGLYKVEASKTPGFKELRAVGDGPPPPGLMLTEDGRFAVGGTPQDLAMDPDTENLSKMRLKGVPAEGPASAPLTVVVFSELQCPHCKKAHEVLKEELRKHPGKVRLLFKHFPLKKLHPWSDDGAIALACAQKLAPGKAGAFKDSVFAAQAELTVKTFSSKAAQFAASAGIPASRFAACVDKRATRAAVDADIAEGEELEVRGVPAIFINGRRLRGYQPEEIRSIIKEMLGED